MSEPVPVLPLEYAHHDAAGSAGPRGKWLRRLVAVTWLACAVATVLIGSVDVETVIVSGPAIFLLGTTMLIVALRARSPWYAVVAACHCAICLLFFMFANWMRWSPDRAARPFLVMGSIYTLISGAASMPLLTRPKRMAGATS